MKKKVYMAGPLFSAAEACQRLREYGLIKEAVKSNNTGHEVFSPIMAPQNDKKNLPTAEEIFLGDEDELLDSEVVFADLDGEDAGVMMELGMVLYNANVKIYPYLTDIRVATAGEYNKHHVPFGYNQFVIGALEHYGHKIYSSFESALEDYKKDFADQEEDDFVLEVVDCIH